MRRRRIWRAFGAVTEVTGGQQKQQQRGPAAGAAVTTDNDRQNRHRPRSGKKNTDVLHRYKAHASICAFLIVMRIALTAKRRLFQPRNPPNADRMSRPLIAAHFSVSFPLTVRPRHDKAIRFPDLLSEQAQLDAKERYYGLNGLRLFKYDDDVPPRRSI
jgi:hypothetical protein